MKSNKEDALAGMTAVNSMASRLQTTAYVWGGFVLDVYKGRFLRSHHDIDYLVLDLLAQRAAWQKLCWQQGWQVQVVANGDLLVNAKGIELHLGNIQRQKVDRVVWTHNGTAAAIRFPADWLNPLATLFCGVSVHTVTAELEYVLKHRPEWLNPNWQTRAKDREALQAWKTILAQRGVDLDALHAQVECL